jgi:hypothetical protein
VERAEKVTYLDTHVVIWLFGGERHRLSSAATEQIRNEELLVSPAVVLELQLLHEMKRLRAVAFKVIERLSSEIGLSVRPADRRPSQRRRCTGDKGRGDSGQLSAIYLVKSAARKALNRALHPRSPASTGTIAIPVRIAACAAAHRCSVPKRRLGNRGLAAQNGRNERPCSARSCAGVGARLEAPAEEKARTISSGLIPSQPADKEQVVGRHRPFPGQSMEQHQTKAGLQMAD